jgi:hypothetical protein
MERTYELSEKLVKAIDNLEFWFLHKFFFSLFYF